MSFCCSHIPFTSPIWLYLADQILHGPSHHLISMTGPIVLFHYGSSLKLNLKGSFIFCFLDWAHWGCFSSWSIQWPFTLPLILQSIKTCKLSVPSSTINRETPCAVGWAAECPLGVPRSARNPRASN